MAAPCRGIHSRRTSSALNFFADRSVRAARSGSPHDPFLMTEKILAVLFVFIKTVIGTTGYGGIALLMAIESACIPLPSELIMPFAGYLVFEGSMKLLWVATAGAIGCNLGSLVAYEIGCYGGGAGVGGDWRWVF